VSSTNLPLRCRYRREEGSAAGGLRGTLNRCPILDRTFKSAWLQKVRPAPAGADKAGLGVMGATVVARGLTLGLASVRVDPMSPGLIDSPVHARMSAETKPRHS
jgi:hypothetical protein